MPMARIIPFAPMPMSMLKRASSPFIRYAFGFSRMFPNLGAKLDAADIEADEREYAAIMLFLTVFYFVFFTVASTLIFYRLQLDQALQVALPFWALGLCVGLLMGFMMVVQVLVYPTLLLRKKVRSLERNLVFALRAILIQIKSGVSLFDGMATIANGEYGAVSTEFKKAVDKINTGTPAEEALEDMAEKNPSPFFRKVLWQIVNGMKAGADISSVLAETVASMIREQKIAISRYGSQLKILSLMYMMLGVIVPALGVTFLIVLGSFPQIKIDEFTFWVMLLLVVVTEFMYVGIIKSRRPTIIG